MRYGIFLQAAAMVLVLTATAQMNTTKMPRAPRNPKDLKKNRATSARDSTSSDASGSALPSWAVEMREQEQREKEKLERQAALRTTGAPPRHPLTSTPQEAPMDAPAESLTKASIGALTDAPTEAPIVATTEAPTAAPTVATTEAPTEAPTVAPTEAPTVAPTVAPIEELTKTPTEVSIKVLTEAAAADAPVHAPLVPPTIAPVVASPIPYRVTRPPAPTVSSNKIPPYPGQARGAADTNAKCREEFKDDDGYFRLPGTQSRYKFYVKPMNWTNAVKACEKERAQLAVPKNEEEAMALVFLMQWAHFPGKASHMHIGISDIMKEGVWRTVDGKFAYLTAYIQWDMNQPAINNKRENCVELHDDLTEVDYMCHAKLTFACERPSDHIPEPEAVTLRPGKP